MVESINSLIMIETIFFDIGGVLFEDFEQPVFHKMVDRYGLSLDIIKKGRMAAWEKLRVGDISEADYWKSIYDAAQINDDPVWAMNQVSYIPFKENWQILGQLKSRSYELGIISNHAKEWVSKLMVVDSFGDYFDHATFSCDDDVKMGKPDQKIFQIALTKTQRSPYQCLFIDDKLANAESARALGMGAAVYKQGQDLSEILRQHRINI